MTYSGIRKPVSVKQLKNGMHVYSHHGDGCNVCGVGVRAGSMNDPKISRGIAHFGEHILSRESDSCSSVDVYDNIRLFFGLDGLKVETFYSSTFYGGILADGRYTKKAFDMFACLLKDRIMSETAFKVESGAIHTEYYLEGMDIVQEHFEALIMKLMFPRHPLGESIVGYPPSIRDISVSKLRSFLRNYYRPDNMFCLIFGPPRARAFEMAKNQFEDMRGTSAEIKKVSVIDFKESQTRKNEATKNMGANLYYLGLGFRTEGYMSNDDAAIEILADILRFRLLNLLREQQGCFSSTAYRAPIKTDRFNPGGYIYAWTALLSEDAIMRAADIMRREFRRLADELIADTERFEYSSSLIKRTFCSKFRDGGDSLADLVVNSSCNGDPELIHLHNYPERLSRLTRRKLKAVAEKYFTSEPYCVLLKPASR